MIVCTTIVPILLLFSKLVFVVLRSSHCVAQTGFKLLVSLVHPPEGWIVCVSTMSCCVHSNEEGDPTGK